MKKNWILTIIICAAVLLAASFLTGFWNNTLHNNVLKVGFVYSGDGSTPYTANFIRAQRALEEQYGDKIEVLTRSNVLSRDAEQPLRELIQAGCTLIFINLDTDVSVTLAWEFPNVAFCQVSLTDISLEGTPENYHTFNSEIYQARYVSGVAAGMKLRQLLDSGTIRPEEAKVGYVGANATAEVISGFTAFFLGVRSIAPEATMFVRYTGSWSNFMAEKKQTQNLIDENCIIISEHVNTSAAAVTCEEAVSAGRTVYFIGYHQSMIDIAPLSALVSIRTNWEPYFSGAAEAVMNSTSIESTVNGHAHGRDICAGFEDDWIELVDLNTLIAADGTEEKIERTIEDIIKGRVNVFSGNYIGVNPHNSAVTIDLRNGYIENQNSSIPSFNYILKDCITIENSSVGD